MNRSWAPEVFVEGQWAGNGVRFATKEEAEAWGRDRLMRWFVPTDSRAVESSDYPNYRWEGDGTIAALCSEGGCGMDAVPGKGLCAGHRRLAVGDPTAEIAPNN